MFSNAKAIALVRDLSDKLSKRLANNSGLNTIVQSFATDAQGAQWPVLTISHNGNVAEGQPVVIIEISNVDMVSRDVFGNPTEAYAPHVLQFGYELASGGAPLPARGDVAVCEYEAIMTGVRFQLKEIANATAVTATSLNAAAAIADLDDMYWPTKKV